MPIPHTVEGVGQTVELVLWRRYGRRGQTAAMLTATLALNPGVAALGPILPLGTPLVLPDLPAEEPVAAPDGAFSLFDD